MNAPVNAAVRRRTFNVENLIKYDLGNGAFLYTNTSALVVRIMWDSGDGIIRSVNLVT